jgi:hypothetical protein
MGVGDERSYAGAGEDSPAAGGSIRVFTARAAVSAKPTEDQRAIFAGGRVVVSGVVAAGVQTRVMDWLQY